MFNIKRFPRLVNSSQVKDVYPVKDIQLNPFKYLSKNLSEKQRLVLNYLLFISSRSPDIYPEQKTIAKHAGLSREWTSKTIGELCSMGLLNKVYRANHSCLYRVSSFFNKSWVRETLKPLFSSLGWVAIIFSTGINGITSHDIKNSFIYKTNTTNISRLSNINFIKGKMERVVNPIIQRLCDKIKFDDYILTEVSKYPDKILELAEKLFESTPNIRDRQAFFLGICKNETLKAQNPEKYSYKHKMVSDNKPSQSQTSQYKPWAKSERTEEQIQASMAAARLRRQKTLDHIKLVSRI
jgi:hypothetical protein